MSRKKKNRNASVNGCEKNIGSLPIDGIIIGQSIYVMDRLKAHRYNVHQ